MALDYKKWAANRAALESKPVVKAKPKTALPFNSVNLLQDTKTYPSKAPLPASNFPMPALGTANSSAPSTTQTSNDLAKGVYGGATILGKLGKEIAQGTARTVGTVGITAGNVAMPGKPFQSEIQTTGSPITRTIFGDTSIKDLPTYGKAGIDFVKEVTGKEIPQGFAIPVAFLGVWADLSTGGGKGKFLKMGKNAKTAQEAGTVLKNAGFSDDVIFGLKLDEKVAKATTEKEIENLFKNAEEWVKKNIPPDNTPPAPALRGTPETTNVNLDSIKDEVISRLESPAPASLPSGRLPVFPVGSEVGDAALKKAADTLKKVKEPTVADINTALETLRVNSRAVEDLAKDLTDYTKSLPPQYAQRAGAQDIIAVKKGDLPTAAPYSKAPDNLMGFAKDGNIQKGFDETKYKYTQPVKITFKDGTTFSDEIKGLNAPHAMERAARNWPGAKIEPQKKGFLAQTKELLSNPAMRQGGYIGSDVPKGFPKAKPETPPAIRQSESLPNGTTLEDLSKTKREAIEQYPEMATENGYKDLTARTRGTVSHQQAIASAERLGWSEEKMLNMPIGKALSDTELMAARGISQHADEVLTEMKRVLETVPENSPAAELLRTNIALQKVKAFKLKAFVVGVSSEAGRALSSLRAKVNSIDALEKRLAKMMNDPNTPQVVKDYIADRIGKFEGTPDEMGKLLRDVQDSSVLEMIVEFATAVKLTSIPTYVVNTATSLGMLKMGILERAISAGFDAARVTLRGGKRERFMADVANEMTGQITGWKNSGREAARALADENYAWNVRQLQDFSLTGPKIKGRAGMNNLRDRFLNRFGKAVRMPFRVLGAQDLLLRQPAEQAARIVAIGRLAIQKGLKPGTSAYTDFVENAIKNPTAEIIEESVKKADRTLFQDELTPALAKLQQYVSDYPAIKFVVPFFKTIVNLQKRAIEYSPLAPILKSVRKDLKTPGAQADALARMTIGSAVMLPLTFEALDGNITLEAPKNPAERDAFFAEGKQAYSIKVGDQWVPFARLSPFSEWFVTAGLMAKAIENEDEESIASLTTNTFFGLTANMFDKSFATGMADLLDAIRGSEKERQNWLENFVVGSTYPTLLGNITRSQDPVIREVNGIKEAYMSRTPFLSQKLNAKKDVFGKDITRQGSAIERLISPVIPSPVVKDVVRTELDSLGITMGFPEKSAGGFAMTPEQYYDYQRIAGNATYIALSKMVMSPAYDNLTSQQKETAVNKVITEVRKNVRVRVASEQVIMKEIQDRLEKGGMSSEQAKKQAVQVYETLKEKQSNSSPQQ